MKIRNRITLIFCLLTGSLLLLIFIFIYYSSKQYTRAEFYQRLRERADIAAQALLEQDELSAGIYNDIRRKHMQILPEEQEAIFRVDTARRQLIDRSPAELPQDFFVRIFDRRYAYTKTDDRYHAGILYTDNEGDFIVVVAARDLYGLAKMKVLLNLLLLSFLTGLLIIYFIGQYYAGRVLKPISAIMERVREISVTNLHLRLDTGDAQDELAELAMTFNKMLDRLETSFDLQNNFVNNASHELRNPLTAILGEIEVALNKDRPAGEYKKSLVSIQQEAQRLDFLVNSLLKLARSGLDGKGIAGDSIRVDELLLDVKGHMDQVYPENQLVFDFEALPNQPDALLIRGDESLLRVALNNLVDNACKFSAGRQVTVGIAFTKGMLQIFVRDQGVGIPADDLKNVAEPFYRAANARGFRGFGIGLPLAQKIIHLHGGRLDISSTVGHGTTATITFPLPAPARSSLI